MGVAGVVVDVVDVVAVVDVVGVVDVLGVVEVVVVLVDVVDVDNNVEDDGDSVDVKVQGGVVSEVVVGDDVGEGVVGCLSGGS